MSIQLAKLVVKLEGDSAKLRRDLNKANSNLQRFDQKAKQNLRSFESSISKAGLAVKGFIAVAAAGFAKTIVSDTFQAADAIGKVSARLNISTDALQEWRRVAELAGSSTGKMDAALQTFSKRVGDAARGIGDFKSVAEQNNIAIRDSNGNVRTLSVIMDDLARAVRDASTQEERNSIVAAAMSKSNLEMVNVLQQGEDALNAQREATAKLEKQLIGTAERLNDRWTVLTGNITVGVQTVVLGIAEVIEQAHSRIEAVIQEYEGVFTRIKAILPYLPGPVGVVASMAGAAGESFSSSGSGSRARLEEQRTDLAARRLKILENIEEIDEDELSNPWIAANVKKAKNEFADLGDELREVNRQLDQLDRVIDITGQIPPAGGGAGVTGELAATTDPFKDRLEQMRKFYDDKSRRNAPVRGLLPRSPDDDADGGYDGVLDEGVRAAETIGSAFASSAASALSNWESVGDLFKNIANQVSSSVISTVVRAGVSSLITGRAAGGPVTGGTPYIVGERGPELFVPQTSGHIDPNPGGGGGGVTINNLGPAITAESRDVQGEREITIRAARSAWTADFTRQFQSGYGPLVQTMQATTNMRTIPR